MHTNQKFMLILTYKYTDTCKSPGETYVIPYSACTSAYTSYMTSHTCIVRLRLRRVCLRSFPLFLDSDRYLQHVSVSVWDFQSTHCNALLHAKKQLCIGGEERIHFFGGYMGLGKVGSWNTSALVAANLLFSIWMSSLHSTPYLS